MGTTYAVWNIEEEGNIHSIKCLFALIGVALPHPAPIIHSQIHKTECLDFKLVEFTCLTKQSAYFVYMELRST